MRRPHDDDDDDDDGMERGQLAGQLFSVVIGHVTSDSDWPGRPAVTVMTSFRRKSPLNARCSFRRRTTSRPADRQTDIVGATVALTYSPSLRYNSLVGQTQAIELSSGGFAISTLLLLIHCTQPTRDYLQRAKKLSVGAQACRRNVIDMYSIEWTQRNWMFQLYAGCGKSELDTGQVDPRVGLRRVGSSDQICQKNCVQNFWGLSLSFWRATCGVCIK